ncbi:hypothetical protein ABFX02_06G188200 [Erythranthe guttata]
MKITLVLLFILANFFQGMASEKRKCIITPKYTIYVANSLPSDSPQLRLHCASKDDDLGFHNLTTGQIFKWDFCNSYIQNTLFFCHLWWGSKDRAFVVFSSKHRNECFSHSCYWEADPEGILFDGVYPPQILVKYYDWKNASGI